MKRNNENVYQTDLFDPEKLDRYRIGLSNAQVVSSFTLPRKELLEALKALWVNYKYYRSDKYFVKVELITRMDHVIIKTKFHERYIQTEPIGFCKAELFYQDLMDAVRSSKKREVPFIVFDRDLTTNGVRLSAAIKEYDPEKDVVRNTPNLEELSDQAEQIDPYAPSPSKNYFTLDGTKGFTRSQFFRDTEMAHHFIQKYGITLYELELFVKTFLLDQKPFEL